MAEPQLAHWLGNTPVVKDGITLQVINFTHSRDWWVSSHGSSELHRTKKTIFKGAQGDYPEYNCICLQAGLQCNGRGYGQGLGWSTGKRVRPSGSPLGTFLGLTLPLNERVFSYRVNTKLFKGSVGQVPEDNCPIRGRVSWPPPLEQPLALYSFCYHL